MSTHSAQLSPTFVVEPLILDLTPELSARDRLRLTSILSAVAVHGLIAMALAALGPIFAQAPTPVVHKPEPVAIRLAPAAKPTPVAEPVPEPVPVVPPPVVKKPEPPPVVTKTISQQPTVPVAAEPKIEEPPVPVQEATEEPVTEPIAEPVAKAAPAEKDVASSPFGSLNSPPISVKEAAVAPKLLRRGELNYPGRARRAGIEGLVVIRAVVGLDGKVEAEHLKVLRSIPALDESALASVQGWHFSPALDADDRPIRVIMNIPVRFSLE